ncbi:plasmid mobilization protein [Mucilaginibacter sp. OK098]|uniref:plasmid mobilization protein n=1 Tax=Mucilaginibacter sp. OK098 TaxID=1855297 RepID=UPI0009157B0A|nr:hypothetical protein [Mucilaginibacter sp. OK098]SHL95658.1 hypothetical protein SAMN05216524_101311 [Mucilaginibacter sp. OK098]
MENSDKASKKITRSEWLHIRLTPDELQKISGNHQRTTSRELSAFARKRLLEEPLTYYTRSASMDEGLQELVQLRKELNAIGNNLNQQTKKLNSFTATPGLGVMVDSVKLLREQLDAKLKEINNSINHLAKQWLQGSIAEKVSKGH